MCWWGVGIQVLWRYFLSIQWFDSKIMLCLLNSWLSLLSNPQSRIGWALYQRIEVIRTTLILIVPLLWWLVLWRANISHWYSDTYRSRAQQYWCSTLMFLLIFSSQEHLFNTSLFPTLLVPCPTSCIVSSFVLLYIIFEVLLFV